MKRIITFSVMAMAMVFAVVGIVREQGRESTLDVSHGLLVIATQSEMAKSAMANNKIVFSVDDFEKFLNVSELSSITITSIPDFSDGCLCVGDVSVQVGQTISASNLNLLNYRATNVEVKQSSFKFTQG